MSTKGKKLDATTRGKISLSKVKIDKTSLVSAWEEYHNQILLDETLLPTIVAYCRIANISRSSLLEYSTQYPEILTIIETIEQLQEEFALTRGINNKANPNFAMFLLKSKHNFKDSPQALTQNNTFNISPDLLADALKIMNTSNTNK